MAYRQKNNNVIMIGRDGAEQAYNFVKYKIDYLELPLTANFLNMVRDNTHIVERYEKADKFSFDFVRSLISGYNDLIAKDGAK